MVGVAEVKEKVQRHLTREFGSISVDQDGDYWVTSGSARVYVSVKEWGERTFIEVFSQTNFGLAPSPELYEWIAKHTAEYRFGHVALVELDDGTARVDFRHHLLGDFLDPDELALAVRAVGITADEIDDEIKGLFGGRLFHDD